MASHALKTPISVFMRDTGSVHLVNVARYGEEYINRYKMMTSFHHQKVPLVILVCGTACVGNSTIATEAKFTKCVTDRYVPSYDVKSARYYINERLNFIVENKSRHLNLSSPINSSIKKFQNKKIQVLKGWEGTRLEK
ncbi:hypothetical protein CR513_13723, partial [Mucuna pruriens]